ncbi:MAG: 50S ribosomal protein L24 [Holosporales bacterium]|jgi:large subunit ribosomal protein L24|nr:50S ribosomal protein L24 [Holosporales bacterium]
MTQPKLKIKRGDQVVVVVGRNKGQFGVVSKVLLESQRVFIENVGSVTRHTRPSMQAPNGVLTKPTSFHVSNVALVDPSTNKPARVGTRATEDGKRVRFFKKSGELVPFERRYK